MNPWIKLIHHLQTPTNGINIAKTLIWKHLEKLKIIKVLSDGIQPSDMDLKHRHKIDKVQTNGTISWIKTAKVKN